MYNKKGLTRLLFWLLTLGVCWQKILTDWIVWYKMATFSGGINTLSKCCCLVLNITYFLACYKLPPFIYLAFVLSDPSNIKDECVNYPETVKKCSSKKNFYSGTIFYTYKPKWFILETYKVLYIVLVILSLHMQPPTIRWLLEYNLLRLRIRFFWNAAA